MHALPRTPFASSFLRLSLGLSALGAGVAYARSERPALPRVVRARYLMGTILEIDAVAAERHAAEAGVGLAFETVAAAEARLSNWRADSELSRVNREAARHAVPISPETFKALRRAFDLARETGGAFDPTVGAVTQSLGLTGEASDAARAAVGREAIGWERVLLDPRRRAVSFQAAGASIDSGAFGKGDALDRALAALERHGVVAARLNFGGQISLLGAGTREGRRLHFDEVAIAAPDGSAREVCRFGAQAGSVSTSGDSERPGHLIDPRTGRAARFHGSVTVLADNGLRADALSTALFVLGPLEGVAFAERRGIAVVYVFPQKSGWTIRASRAFPRLSASRKSA